MGRGNRFQRRRHMRALAGLRAFMPAGPFMAHGASAATTSFSLTDFSLGATVLNGVGLFYQPESAPALPASDTFTLTLDPADVYLPRYDGHFLRYGFDLPSGFRDLEFTFETLVNDTFALPLCKRHGGGDTGIDDHLEFR